MNYHNEHDPKAAAWLRELIKQNLIPAGDVDERSIVDVQPHELNKYTQCHFFAGVGGWPYALQLAGVPSTTRLWTGSCPCQPFSTAGRQKGNDDERHLWPAFFNLIRECRPNHVFGEQVANAIGHGWLDGISADLESEGYACGAAVLGAHSVGAPHIQQRLYWVAHANHGGLGKLQKLNSKQEVNPANRDSQGGHSDGCGDSGRLGNPNSYRTERPRGEEQISVTGCENRATACGTPDTGSQRRKWRQGAEERSLSHGSDAGRLESDHGTISGHYSEFWSHFDLIPCRDGKSRRVEPSLFPLAHGVPGRVGLLRGSGNAIVPQVAAQFIQAAEAAFNHEMRTVCH